MGSFIRVSSPKFPILPGEAEELVNEGMYGKALAEYLMLRLRAHGYDAPSCVCEDWGWWVTLAGFPFTFGVCIYGREQTDGSLDLYVTDGAPKDRTFSWKKLQFVSRGADAAAAKLHADLLRIFGADLDVTVLATDLESPFVDDEDAS